MSYTCKPLCTNGYYLNSFTIEGMRYHSLDTLVNPATFICMHASRSDPDIIRMLLFIAGLTNVSI
jgi:hypothetical protein